MTGSAATRSSRQAMAVVAAATVASLLPVFLTGALAVQLRDELAFGASALGLAVGLFRVSGALTSVPFGRLTDRLGATRSMRLAIVVACVASLGIATTSSWGALAAWLALAGCGPALSLPAANRMLVNAVSTRSLGTAFGIKQSAPPTASLLGGLSVPLIGLTFGWRWAYVAGAVLALGVVLVLSARPPQALPPATAAVRRDGDHDPRTHRLLAVGFGLGVAAAGTVSAFYVDTAVRAGSSAQAASLSLGVASAVAIGVRLASGVLVNRIRVQPLVFCATLISIGTAGFVLLATNQPTVMIVGAIIALGGTWGFSAVFWFVLVSRNADAPGRATGAPGTGGALGGITGPVLFGGLVDLFGQPTAWSASAVVSMLSALAFVVAARRVRDEAPV